MNRDQALVVIMDTLVRLTSGCDRAVQRDNQGWNVMDAERGHRLTEMVAVGQPFSLADQRWVGGHLPKYHRQFSNPGQVREALEVLGWLQLAQAPWEDRERVAWELGILPSEVAITTPRLDYHPEEKKFYLHMRRFQDNSISQTIPSPRWIDGAQAWRYLDTPKVRDALRQLRDRIPTITDLAQARLDAPEPIVPNLPVGPTTEQLATAQRIRSGELQELDVPLHTSLYAHQQAAYEIAVTLDHTALLMEQGTGKTLVAIAAAGHRYLQGQVKRLLVVAPLSVLSEWRRQFREHTAFPHRIEVLTGSMALRSRTLKDWEDTSGLQVVVINYDGAWRMLEDLVEWKPDMVIADESQQIKNGQAQRSKALHILGKRTRYRMILTGTPVAQSPLDFFSQYKFLDPSIFGNSYVRFRDRYAIMGGYGGYQVVGYQNLEELAAKAHSIAYRVTKAEALDLPPIVNQTVYARLKATSQRAYDTMAQESLLKVGNGTVTAPIILTQMLRLQQITGGFIPTPGGEVAPIGTEKLEALEETLDGLMDAGKKVVIFARFIPEIKAISERLTSSGINHVTLVGGVTSAGREEAIRQFQENPTVRVFLAQIATGGLGITLTAADTAIFYSVDYSLINYEQAKARIHRIGQTQKVTYINIVAEGTIDEEVLEALQGKLDLAHMVVDELKAILFGRREEPMRTSTVLQNVHETVDDLDRNDEHTDITPEIEQLLDDLEKELRDSGQITDVDDPVEIPVPEVIPTTPTVGKGSKKNPRRTTDTPRRVDPPATPATPVSTNTSPEEGTGGELLTLKELAAELDVEPRRLRKWLRNHFDREDGRWEWKANDPIVTQIRQKFQH